MSNTTTTKDLVGIIVGGGPAPGINGVISAAVIEANNQGKQVVGFVGGLKSFFDGKVQALPLTINDVSRIHNTGGSILRTSRDTRTHAEEKLTDLIRTLQDIGIKYLITIGGDGTLYMANWIAQASQGAIKVVHTPKTIDNDIPLPGGFSTFGYQTARHLGALLVDNIIEDARTTGRWYLITVMGRHTGHLALGIGQASGATLSIIPEEFAHGKKITVKHLADILMCSIIKRLTMQRDYGVAVLAEGIAELLNSDELQQYSLLDKNEKGEMKLSEVRLGKILKDSIKQNLKQLGIEVKIVDKHIGYELRAASPIPFDMEYVRALGYGAIRYLMKGDSGVMITRTGCKIKAVPFTDLIDKNTGKANIRKVDINSENYEVARKYMIRLEREDLEGETLNKLAQASSMTPEEFKTRFAYIV